MSGTTTFSARRETYPSSRRNDGRLRCGMRITTTTRPARAAALDAATPSIARSPGARDFQNCHRSGMDSRSGLSAERARHSSSAAPAPPRIRSGPQTASHGGDELPFGHLPSLVLEDVIGKDDGDARNEGGKLAAASLLQSEGEADQREDQTRDGQRELAVQGHQRPVRRQPLLLQLGGPRPQLGNRHLVVALQDLGDAEDAVGIEPENQLRKAGDLVLRRVLQVRGVPGALQEDEIDAALLTIDDEPAGAGGEDGRLLRTRGVGEETHRARPRRPWYRRRRGRDSESPRRRRAA